MVDVSVAACVAELGKNLCAPASDAGLCIKGAIKWVGISVLRASEGGYLESSLSECKEEKEV